MDFTFCKTALVALGDSLDEKPDPCKFEKHCHTKYEILYIVKGSGKCIVEGTEYPLSDGAVFLLRPFEYHYVCPDPESPYERYVFNFKESVLYGGVRELPMLSSKSQGIYFSPPSVGVNFCNAISNAEEFFKKNDPKGAQSEAMTITLVNQLLLLLAEKAPQEALSDDKTLINGIIDYLNENLGEKISLDETAKTFFISKYYLCRLFKKHTGVSMLAYLNSKRIAKARHLIASGERATAVAYAVGFHDYSSFYRAYVKETGKPPTVSKQNADHKTT